MFYSFNNHLFEKGDGIIGSANVDWVRYINLTQTSGGTITAIPLSGRNGDTITLSNTPSAGFKLDSYSVTGANLTGDKFNILNSDVTVQGSFVPSADKLILYQNNNNFSSYNTLTVNTNATSNNDYYRYWNVKFNRRANMGVYMACDCQINFNNQTYWMRSHYHNQTAKRHCYMGWPGGTDGKTTFTNINATTDVVDSKTLYLTTATKLVNASADYNYVFDRTNGWCSAYIDGVLGGVIKPTNQVTLTSCNNLKAWQEQTGTSRYSYFKNIKIGVSHTWSGAYNL